MRRLAVIAVASLLIVSSWTEPAAANTLEAEAGERVVCKLQQRTGTRFKAKVCKTAAQWEEMAEKARMGAQELANRPHIRICGPNGCD